MLRTLRGDPRVYFSRENCGRRRDLAHVTLEFPVALWRQSSRLGDMADVMEEKMRLYSVMLREFTCVTAVRRCYRRRFELKP